MYKITLEQEDFLRYQLFTASQSKRIRQKRIRSWILLTVSFLVLGIVLIQDPNQSSSYYFLALSIITLILYPIYQRWQYKRHYEKHIADNYANRIGIESELVFEDGLIISRGANQEGKIKLTEIQEINEISDNLFIKIKTGESIIIPSRIYEYGRLKEELNELIQLLGVSWNEYFDWKWN
ncbi:MAG: YcxB family protein [Bacteroidota bacterium]